jgi:hypothetical protein
LVCGGKQKKEVTKKEEEGERGSEEEKREMRPFVVKFARTSSMTRQLPSSRFLDAVYAVLRISLFVSDSSSTKEATSLTIITAEVSL